MSNFNKHAQSANEIAKAAFEEYRKAESALKKAEEQARKYTERPGLKDPEYLAKSARANADLIEAREAMKKAKRDFENHAADLAAVRKTLEADIEKTYCINPALLDINTLELMKSGIMTSNDYAKILNDAEAAGNYTMVKIISKYAGVAAKKREDRNGFNDPEARALRAIEYKCRETTGSEHLKAFDFLMDVYNRAVRNPAMIDHWDSLTSEVLRTF